MVYPCNDPTAIKEGDLSTYLSGTASASIKYHIDHCIACQTEIKDLKTVHAILDDVFYKSDCPDEDLLLAYQSGFMTRLEQKTIKQHLPDCSYCTQFVANLKIIDEQPDPLLTRILQTGKRMLASIFQPAQPQPALALLGDEQQQYIYQAEQYQIILTTSIPLRGSNLWEIEGHIIDKSNPQTEYEGCAFLLQNAKDVVSDKIDEFGFFALENINPGRYALHLELSNIIIPIEDFTIRLGIPDRT